jgi:hypothetical protein
MQDALKFYVSIPDQININSGLQVWAELGVAVAAEVEVLVNPNPARVNWCDLTSTQENEEGCMI